MSDSSGFFKSAMAALGALAGRASSGDLTKDQADKAEALEKISKEIMKRMADEAKVKASGETYKEAADAIVEIMATEPEVKQYRFVGKLGWAWEVENSADNDEIHFLLAKHKKAVNMAAKMAEILFRETAERAMKGTANQSYIDEEGTNLALPPLPFSPYSDPGAAFMISLAYTWRGMAEEWNAQEKERIAAEQEKQRDEMAEYMAQQTQKMIREMAEKGEKALKSPADDKLDAMSMALPKRFITPDMLATTPISQSSGVSKIAAGLALGELKKSKF